MDPVDLTPVVLMQLARPTTARAYARAAEVQPPASTAA